MATDTLAATRPRRASILERLRRETVAAHARAEAAVRLLQYDATIDDYRAYLRAMARVHAAIAPALESDSMLKVALGDLSERLARGARAAADLVVLGDHSVVASGHPTSPFAPALSLTHDPETMSVPGARLGALYVLEGSSLGGRVLLQRLRDRFGDSVPASFLTGYGDATGRMWKRFTVALEDVGILHPVREIIMGAKACFEARFEALSP